MKVILLSGKARAGKDTCAVYMLEKLENLGKSVAIIHYADVLKFVATEYIGWNGKKDEQGRQLLQKTGTDIRNSYSHFFVDFVMTLLDSIFHDYDYVIVPDCRYKNELLFAWGHAHPNQVIRVRVERPGYDNGLTKEQKNHPSETELDDYEFPEYIYNTESLDILRFLCHQFIKKITK